MTSRKHRSALKFALLVAGLGAVALAAAAATPPAAGTNPHGPVTAGGAPVFNAGPTKTAEGTFREECSGCHIAYPAKLLPADSWREVMATLDKHFGVNASLDDPQLGTISRYLESHAGPRTRPVDPKEPMRISRSPWFVHEHREVSAAEWSSSKVKSAANCVACHKGADKGNFEEDEMNEREGRGGRGGERDND